MMMKNIPFPVFYVTVVDSDIHIGQVTSLGQIGKFSRYTCNHWTASGMAFQDVPCPSPPHTHTVGKSFINENYDNIGWWSMWEIYLADLISCCIILSQICAMYEVLLH